MNENIHQISENLISKTFKREQEETITENVMSTEELQANIERCQVVIAEKTAELSDIEKGEPQIRQDFEEFLPEAITQCEGYFRDRLEREIERQKAPIRKRILEVQEEIEKLTVLKAEREQEKK
jgi:thiamine phosphate synthase YjbQ (UPF0047 family)